MSLLSDKLCLTAMIEVDVFKRGVSLFLGVAKVYPSMNTASLLALYSFGDKGVMGEHVGRTK